jgi:hypothetical protein
MTEPRLQLSEDTWAYVDQVRLKLVVEIDLPKDGIKADKDESKEHQLN